MSLFCKQCTCILGILCIAQVSLAGDNETKVTFSGNNFFEARYGKKPRDHGFFEKDDFFNDGEYRIEPWYYIKNLFDINIGINKFYYRGRFQVDEPTMGYHPQDIYWYREFLPLRTFGYNGDILSIEAGNFKTEFGRGITISLKEDPQVELSNLLDGVHLMSELPFCTIKAFAGRNSSDKNLPIFEDPDSNINVVNFIDDYQFRDNILGSHIELFPFSYIPFLSFLSASSLGGGILNYRNYVSKLDGISDIDTVITATDTSFDTSYAYTQSRTNIILPSWLVNFSLGDLTIYGEFARGFTNEYDYVDSLNEEDIVSTDKSYAAFLEISGPIGDFYLRGEYVNYFYGLESVLTGSVLSRYTDAPWARFKHLWHLLAKHTLIPHVQNHLGYNAEVTWTPSDRTQLLLTGNFGGHHEPLENDSTKYSLFKFGEGYGYYDIYAELNKKIREKIELKVGIDYGHIDPKEFDDVLYRTLASKVTFGPFNEKHSFGLQCEVQYNTFTFYAEEDYYKVKERILEVMPISEINPNDLTNPDPSVFTKYYASLDDEDKSKQEYSELNWLGELSYSFSSYVKLHGLIEFETLVGDGDENEDIFIVDQIKTKSRLFPSGGFSFTPVPNHTFIFEGGSFSRVKLCNMGICTIIPAFKGLKFTIKSIL